MRILLCTEGLAGAHAATTWLERFVPSEPSSLCMAAIAQIPPLGLRSSSARSALRELMRERSRRFCEATRSRLQDRWADMIHVADGDPHERLLRAAEEWKADLVVLGRSSSGDPSPLPGSVARLGARYLECSALLVDRGLQAVILAVQVHAESPARSNSRRLYHRRPGLDVTASSCACHAVFTDRA